MPLSSGGDDDDDELLWRRKKRPSKEVGLAVDEEETSLLDVSLLEVDVDVGADGEKI